MGCAAALREGEEWSAATATSAPRVYVTGSLTASPGPNPALQVVTEDDLMLTGRIQMGPALRMLVPSIQ